MLLQTSCSAQLSSVSPPPLQLPPRVMHDVVIIIPHSRHDVLHPRLPLHDGLHHSQSAVRKERDERRDVTGVAISPSSRMTVPLKENGIGAYAAGTAGIKHAYPASMSTPCVKCRLRASILNNVPLTTVRHGADTIALHRLLSKHYFHPSTELPHPPPSSAARFVRSHTVASS